MQSLKTALSLRNAKAMTDLNIGGFHSLDHQMRSSLLDNGGPFLHLSNLPQKLQGIARAVQVVHFVVAKVPRSFTLYHYFIASRESM